MIFNEPLDQELDFECSDNETVFTVQSAKTECKLLTLLTADQTTLVRSIFIRVTLLRNKEQISVGLCQQIADINSQVKLLGVR